MNRRLASLYAGLLFAVLGVVAWASGEPFVFPSLGPSAFIMAVEGRGEPTTPRRVVGSHTIGAVVGFLAHAALASGVALTAPAAGSLAGAGLVASGVLSVAVTSWGMLLTGTEHAPACATTLIVSLGLLATPAQVGVIVVSVGVLAGVHWTVSSRIERTANGWR